MKEEHYKTNGTDVYFAQNNNLHSFCIGAYIYAGSMFETEKDNGISHLYEHIVFRNLKNLYDRDIYELMSENGIFLEACTYKEFTYFHIYGITQGFSLAADILSKMFLPLTVSASEFVAEKNRIKAEIREKDDKNTLEHFHNSKFWYGTPLAQTVAGSKSAVCRISLKKLNEFRDTVISYGNIFFYVTGKISEENKARLLKVISGIPISDLKLKRNVMAPIPQYFGKRGNQIHIKPFNYTYVGVSFDIDNRYCPTTVRNILYSVLLVGDDSAVNQALSENSAVIYSYDCFLEQYKNISRFYFSYEINPADIYKSLEAVIKAIRLIKKGEFNFKANLQKEITNWCMMQDNPGGLNWALAYEKHILEEKECDFSKPGLGWYDSVDKEAVVLAAEKIFTRSNMMISFKGRKKDIDSAKVNEVLDKLGR